MATSSRVIVTAIEKGQGRILATVWVENGKVMMDGDAGFIEEIKDGVLHPLHKKIYTPEDGEQFLNALTLVYDSPYLMATMSVD